MGKSFVCCLFRVSLLRHRVGNWKFLFATPIGISTWKMIFSILCFSPLLSTPLTLWPLVISWNSPPRVIDGLTVTSLDRDKQRA